jgi:SAM-dependent methyltransferase
MDSLRDRIRQQFDFGPYPRIPLDTDPQQDGALMLRHSWLTPHYLHYGRIPDSRRATILDAGCGTGYRTLALAQANPGAKVVGIDLSPQSIDLARSRLSHHGRPDVSFHVLDIQDLPKLGMQFDYINCDDTLYLFDDPAIGLQQLRAVLKLGGILRANLHSAYQREAVYRGQALFRQLGLFNQNPETAAVETVQTFMGQLKGWVNLKRQTWKPKFAQADATEDILMNYLFQGDRGYTVFQLFAALDTAGLDFISMVNWQQWRLSDLFDQPETLPADLAQQLNALPVAERLQLFELLHPIHRLLDFWCVAPPAPDPSPVVANWDAPTWAAQWMTVTVQLHPQLCTADFRQACLNSWRSQKPLAPNAHFDPGLAAPVVLDSRAAVLLLPLIDNGPQPMLALIRRYLDLFPRDPATLDLTPPEMALAEVKNLLTRLEPALYVLLEARPNQG